jgi:hypothetical protein
LRVVGAVIKHKGKRKFKPRKQSNIDTEAIDFRTLK